MKNVEKKCKKSFLVEEYLSTYDPRQPVSIGFSISDAYRYAKSVNKKISELTQKEINQFTIKNNLL